MISPLSASFTKWSNTLKQFVGNMSTNCLSVFGQFVGLALKGLEFITLEIHQHLCHPLPIKPLKKCKDLEIVFSEILTWHELANKVTQTS